MKTKLILLSLGLFFFITAGHAQKNERPRGFISEKVTISKYHNKGELERMQKGQLIALYSERIGVLVRILPYVAFATKPGVTMSSLGIPTNSDNVKALEEQLDTTDKYVERTENFHSKYLPYSDTNNLIAGILFYEEVMKSIHQYNDFR